MISLPVIVGAVEFATEIFIVFQLIMFFLNKSILDRFNLKNICFFVAIIFALFSDTVYNVAIIAQGEHYEFLSDCLYVGFAFFLLMFVLLQFLLPNRKKLGKGFFLVFCFFFVLGFSLSHFYIVDLYYKNEAFSWSSNGGIYIAGIIYNIICSLIFAITIPYSIRVLDRKIFWFFNLLLLLLSADYAIRYQYEYINSTYVSWIEFGWASFFVGISAMMFFSREKVGIFFKENSEISTIISIRSLLTIAIVGFNVLFLAGMLFFKMSWLKNGIDISNVLFVLFVFWSIANEFSIWLASDLKNILNVMVKSSESLKDTSVLRLQEISVRNPVFEISKILESYNVLIEKINNMVSYVVLANKNLLVSEVASQVSHDIRSPLAALDMTIKTIDNLSEHKKNILNGSIRRVRDIANNLLMETKKISPSILYTENTRLIFEKKETFPYLVSALVDRLVSEKIMEYQSSIGLEINYFPDESAYGVFSTIDPKDFMIVLSNLVNNAVESILGEGRVTLSLKQENDVAVLRIKDNGCGIDSNIINELCEKGVSYGKKDGTGLGLYHARNILQLYCARLSISSAPKQGTTVDIHLPCIAPPNWFVEKIIISKNQRVVVLDDDLAIHQIWRMRFDSLGGNIDLLHLSRTTQLRSFLNGDAKEDTLYLIDYDIKGDSTSGLALIDELGIASNAILVTSHYEEHDVVEWCKNSNVRLLPKELVFSVPIFISQ